MIDKNELRLGNWLITERGIPQQVAYVGDTIGFHNEIGGTDKHQKNPIFSYDIDYIQPIPLTPEILEKAGFIENPDHEHPQFDEYIHSECKKFGIGDFNGEFWIVDAIDQWFGSTQPELKYLHQLQNLYFSLCGTELNIEL